MLTRQADPGVFVPRMVQICAAAGVAVVLIPEITGARCSGASRWVARRPVVQLSLRHRSDDHLWFTFFHELGHVLLHGRREVFIDDGPPVNSGLAGKEEEANRFASELLIPSRFDAELRRLKRLTAIEAFAERIGVSPGIVVGRLQKDRVIGYQIGNGLKRRFHFPEPAAS